MSNIPLAYVLSKYRTQAGLTIAQVSAKVSLPESVIRNFEEGLYARTQIIDTKEALKRLCYLYHLQYKEVEKLYVQETSLTGQKLSNRKPIHIDRLLRGMTITDRTLRRALIASGMMMVIGYVSYQSFAFVRAPKVHLDNISDFQYVNESRIVLRGKVDTGGKLTLNGEQVTLESDGHFSIDVDLSPGENPLQFETQRGQNVPSVSQKIVYLK